MINSRDFTFGKTIRQHIEAQFLWAEAIQRRQSPEQHEIAAAITRRLFDRKLIGRRLDHAQGLRIARIACTQHAHGGFAERAATRAIADALHCCGEFLGQSSGSGAIAFEHVKRHALRGFGTDAGQAAQCFDQFVEQGRTGHQESRPGEIKTAT